MIDDQQANANFAHAAKKQKPSGNQPISKASLDDMIRAAQRPQGSPEKSEEGCSGLDSIAAETPQKDLVESDEEQRDAELAAEAALGVLQGDKKRGQKGAKKRGASLAEGVADSGKKPKKGKTDGFLVASKEKADKELKELMVKFQKNALLPGPLANKKKALSKNMVALQEAVLGREDECSVNAVAAWTLLVDCGERMLGLLGAYSQLKALIGPSMKLRGNAAHDAAANFHAEMQLCRQVDSLMQHMPSAYHELDFKIIAWRAIEEKTYDVLAATISLVHVGAASGSTLTGDGAAAVQRSVMTKLVLESVQGPEPGEVLSEWLSAVDFEQHGHFVEDIVRDVGVIKLVIQTATAKEAETMVDSNLEAQVGYAKAATTGPLFHFRVSAYGGKCLTELAKKAQSQRSNMIFERRWTQTSTDMKVIESFQWDAKTFFTDLLCQAQVFDRIAENRTFLKSAPASFWTPDVQAAVTIYEDALKKKVFVAMGSAVLDMSSFLVSQLADHLEKLPEDVAGAGKFVEDFSFNVQAMTEEFKGGFAILSKQANTATASMMSFFGRAIQVANNIVSVLDFGAKKVSCKSAVKELATSACSDFARMRVAMSKDGDCDALFDGLKEYLGIPSSHDDLDHVNAIVNLCSSIESHLADISDVVFSEAVFSFAMSLSTFAPEFKQLCDKLGKTGTMTEHFFPIDFDAADFVGKLTAEGIAVAIQQLSQFKRVDSSEKQLRDAVAVWKDRSILREVQLAVFYNDAHVMFYRVANAFHSTILLSCPAVHCHRAAFVSVKSAGAKASNSSSGAGADQVGERYIVNNALVNLIGECRKMNTGLKDYASPTLEVTIGDEKVKVLQSKCRTMADAALAGIASKVAKRWLDAIDAGHTALLEHFPDGDWRKKALLEVDADYIKGTLIKNPNPKHVRMAQLCEWLENNVRETKDP
ncbi:unnamed protein product [Prorocentrum cordatum]|uniref:Exocyst complex component Sec6 n=1 Tax=Prorocentrum cordatum TaxID=2364126 RepID=A0ABN9QNR9_9DINO|nr:unnamed protein product [Polarella glacialis]